MKYFRENICLLMAIILLQSCQADFLDEKPDKSLVIPTSLSELEALLDNTAIMNTSPGLSDLCTDDYHVTDEAWTTLSQLERNAYTWQADLFPNPSSSEWNNPYRQIFYANIVLDEIAKSKTDVSVEKKNVLKGAALFYRSIAFYQLLQLFAQPYIPGQNDDQPGIPLNLSSRIDQNITRRSLKECYLQITRDLTNAVSLLPNLPEYKSRPSRIACYALLARINLILKEYSTALTYSDSTLFIHKELLDYNKRDRNPNLPAFPTALPNGNTEVLFHSFKSSYNYLTLSNVVIDSVLVKSYNNDDLRKSLLLLNRGNGRFTFRGSYNGSMDQFSGLALDETYLIRSESLARLGRNIEAISTLNTLLLNRYEKGKFIPISENDSKKLLDIILSERRKQLLGRGMRWVDLRRLNSDSGYQVTLRRKIGGDDYLLPPNHPNYVFPIPQNEIQNSGIDQNQRK